MTSSLLLWLDRHPDPDREDDDDGARGADYLLVPPMKNILGVYWGHDGSGGGEPLVISASEMADRLDRYSFDHGVAEWQSDGTRLAAELRSLPKGAVVHCEWKL